jgi:predicted dehydrogenase
MRVGVVGCGYWGSKHLRVMQGLNNVERIVAIDERPDRLANLAPFPSAVQKRSLLEALPEVDAVVIATPPGTHHALGMQALRAGKSVLIEKPLATSVAGAVELTELADREGLTLMVGHTFEYNPAVWKLRDLVQEGALGQLFYIDTARLNLGLYQPDCDVIWDLAPHDISIINYLVGSQPSAVRAWGVTHAHPTLLDVAYLSIFYEDRGIWAQVHVSWLDPCKVRRVTVVGSDRMAVYNDLADEERIRIYDKSVDAVQDPTAVHEAPLTYRYGGISAPYIPFREPLATEDAHFLDCVAEGITPTSDGYSGVAVVTVLDAADRAIREQRTVRIPQVLSDAGPVAVERRSMLGVAP